MKVRVRCSKCLAVVVIDQETQTAQVQCPACHALIRLPPYQNPVENIADQVMADAQEDPQEIAPAVTRPGPAHSPVAGEPLPAVVGLDTRTFMRISGRPLGQYCRDLIKAGGVNQETVLFLREHLAELDSHRLKMAVDLALAASVPEGIHLIADLLGHPDDTVSAHAARTLKKGPLLDAPTMTRVIQIAQGRSAISRRTLHTLLNRPATAQAGQLSRQFRSGFKYRWSRWQGRLTLSGMEIPLTGPQLGLVVVALAATVWVTLTLVRTGEVKTGGRWGGGDTQAWFYEPVKQGLFVGSSTMAAPYRNPQGQEAWRAYYFSCGACTETERFLGYYEKASTEGKLYSTDGKVWRASAADLYKGIRQHCKGKVHECLP